MLDGIIVKGIGGFYYVETSTGIYECRARGNFRTQKITPLIGDKVQIESDEINRQGYIRVIYPRKNEMIRPTVSNLDQVVITFASCDPEINMKLLQKLLVYGQLVGLEVIVCINKCDLARAGELEPIIKMLESIPYRVIKTSTTMGIGIEELKTALKDKITVFAGPSGVGKSSLLNAIQPGFQLKIGELSKKISRGTHTTRHAELMNLDIGGKVLDTPGFSSLDLLSNDVKKLLPCFPEFEAYENCRFTGCIHINEPDCGVKKAVAEGEISAIRYDYYKIFYEELKHANDKLRRK